MDSDGFHLLTGINSFQPGASSGQQGSSNRGSESSRGSESMFMGTCGVAGVVGEGRILM